MDRRIPRRLPEFHFSNQTLRIIDGVAVAATLGAMAALYSPNLHPEVAKGIQIIIPELVGYFVLRGYLGWRDKVSERENRIYSGQEVISKTGEQLYILGGNGHPAVDKLFQSNSMGTIPIVNSSAPSYSLVEYFRGLNRTPPYGFFLNLEIDPDQVGTNVINTRSLEKIEFSEENLLSTSSGLMLVSCGFGGSLVSRMLDKPDECISLDEQQILHRRLLSQASQRLKSDSSIGSVMIRIADAYRKVERGSFLGLFGDLIERHRIEKGPNTLDDTAQRSVIWIDSMTPIIKELLKYAEPGWGVILNSSIPNLQLPFLEEFGLVSMNVESEQTMNLARSGKYITVVIEANDVSTLAALEHRRERFKEPIPLFDSHQAAEIARQWGYTKPINAAEVYERIIKEIQTQLRLGKKVFEIQRDLDDEFLHRQYLRNITDKIAIDVGKDLDE